MATLFPCLTERIKNILISADIPFWTVYYFVKTNGSNVEKELIEAMNINLTDEQKDSLYLHISHNKEYLDSFSCSGHVCIPEVIVQHQEWE